jgi:O-antigen ligase
MISITEKKWLEFSILICAVGVSLFFTPGYSAEPLNLSKFFLLLPLAFFVAGFILNSPRVLASKSYRAILIIAAVFLAQLVLVLLFSGAPFNQQFFGTLGRSTGFLTYLSLLLIFLVSIFISSDAYVVKLSKTLFLTGLIAMFYGTLQFLSLDPVNWANPYNPIIGFLGNPNFQSSFLGFSCALAFALLFKRNFQIKYRILTISYLLYCLFLIYKTDAIQGLLLYGISAALTFLIFLFKCPGIKKIYGYSLSGILLIIFGFIVAGILNSGPLAQFLFKASVRQRGFYWEAALEMLKSHPLLGVGLDSYADWYFSLRSSTAAIRSIKIQSNAAHNVYLDIASNGGIILFGAYVLLNIFVLVAGIRVIRNNSEFNPFFISIFIAWVGYQIQSIVSINQIGLAIWGWVLGGTILGFYYSNSQPREIPSAQLRKKNGGRQLRLAIPSLLLVFGLLLASPPLLADHGYVTALKIRTVDGIMNSTKTFPEDLDRTLQAANLLANNNLNEQALQLTRHIVTENPRAYNAWLLILRLTPVDSKERNFALSKIRELNPHDTTIV